MGEDKFPGTGDSLQFVLGFLFVVFLALGGQAVGAETPEGRLPPGYVSEVLDNGLRVSILPDPALPIVATQVWYHVGAANEDEGSRGLAITA